MISDSLCHCRPTVGGTPSDRASYWTMLSLQVAHSCAHRGLVLALRIFKFPYGPYSRFSSCEEHQMQPGVAEYLLGLRGMIVDANSAQYSFSKRGGLVCNRWQRGVIESTVRHQGALGH